jgi:hypothetical protein
MLEMRGAPIQLKNLNYMKDFLKYPLDKLRLLQKIYRHKIVHLSQPKPAMLLDNQIVAWMHEERDPSKHLTIDLSWSIIKFSPIYTYSYISLSNLVFLVH